MANFVVYLTTLAYIKGSSTIVKLAPYVSKKFTSKVLTLPLSLLIFKVFSKGALVKV